MNRRVLIDWHDDHGGKGGVVSVVNRDIRRLLKLIPRVTVVGNMTGELLSVRPCRTTVVSEERAQPQWRPLQSDPHERTGKVRGQGYDHVHAATDDHARLAYAEILPDEKGSTCAGFLLRATAYFASHGIPTTS